MDQRQRKFEHPLESQQMYSPERLPPNPFAPQGAPFPPPTVPLHQMEGGKATHSKKGKKKSFQNMLRKKLETRIERRMEKRPAEDLLSKINEKIKNYPSGNKKDRRKRRNLERKMKAIKQVEKRRLAAAAHV